MATLTKGRTFVGGETVTAEKLNDLVDNATVSGVSNSDIAANAAIALTKLAAVTAGQVVMGNASNVPTATALSGDVTVSSSGVTAIGSGVIVNADISASAEIAVAKLADGAARQLLQTDAAGTGVEWTSDVDVPGTLDVTGAATFDSTVTVTGAATLNGGLTMGDADNVAVGTTTGTKIGTATTQKIGFWNATPVVQPAGANQAALTNSTGGTADGTLSAVTDTMATDQSATINNNFAELHTLLNEIRTALVNTGIIKGAA